MPQEFQEEGRDGESIGLLNSSKKVGANIKDKPES
jgi:hypothetical protein